MISRTLAFLCLGVALLGTARIAAAEGPGEITVAAIAPSGEAHVEILILGHGAAAWETFIATEMRQVMDYFESEFAAPRPPVTVYVHLNCWPQSVASGGAILVSVCEGYNGGRTEDERAARDHERAREHLAHEYWHIVQAAAGYMGFAPRWLVEGQAEFAARSYVYRADPPITAHLATRYPAGLCDSGTLSDAALALSPYHHGALALQWLDEHAPKSGHVAYWAALDEVQEEAWAAGSAAVYDAGEVVLRWDHPAIVSYEHAAFARAFGIERADFFREACEAAAP